MACEEMTKKLEKGRVNEVEPKDDDEAARDALESETHFNIAY